MTPNADQVSDWDYNLRLCTISLSPLLLSSCNQWKFGCSEKVHNPIFDSIFQINTLKGLEQKSGWLLTVILPNYILRCCYVFGGAKYNSSSKIAGSGYNVVIRLMEIPKYFDKRHHVFTDNLFKTYASAAYLMKRLFSNWEYA